MKRQKLKTITAEPIKEIRLPPSPVVSPTPRGEGDAKPSPPLPRIPRKLDDPGYLLREVSLVPY